MVHSAAGLPEETTAVHASTRGVFRDAELVVPPSDIELVAFLRYRCSVSTWFPISGVGTPPNISHDTALSYSACSVGGRAIGTSG